MVAHREEGGGVIRFTVPGTPVAKGRPRITTWGGIAHAYTPAKTVAYERLVALAGKKAMDGALPSREPLSVSATAVFPIPKSWPRKRREAAHWHTSRPDGDNIAKALGDGLNGVCWHDDSQVAVWRIVKCYGETPGLHVEVAPL